MKTRAAKWTVTGAALLALGLALPNAPAIAAPGLPKAPIPVPRPPVTTPIRPITKGVPPKVLPSTACGVAQVQCYVGGGRASGGAADRYRMKVCKRQDDPRFGCGSCERCLLVNTVGAFCGPRGCDYKSCAPGYVDADGDRANGCEQYRPSPPAKPANAALRSGMPCMTDAQCVGDLRCRASGQTPGLRTCQNVRCQSDAECSYLNLPRADHGFGRCSPGRRGADGNGCVFEFPQCSPFQQVDSRGSCFKPAGIFDADGDGRDATQYGGDDCDDSDPSRFPGNAEVCDLDDHDEDCNSATFGEVDVDGDGLPASRCCNVQGNGQKTCGSDCDDANPAIVRGSMRCLPDGRAAVCTNGAWDPRPCPEGTRCVPQPNGLGVCR